MREPNPPVAETVLHHSILRLKIIAERLEQIMVDVVSESSGEIMEMEVMPDQVHLLVGIDPQYGGTQFGEADQRLCYQTTETT